MLHGSSRCILKFWSERNVVTSHVLMYVVRQNAIIIKSDHNRFCRIKRAQHNEIKALTVNSFKSLVIKFILTRGH